MAIPGRRSDTASRLVHAPAKVVYDAFASADSLERWLPPAGMHGNVLEYDFRPGGRYRIELRYDDATRRGKSTAGSDISSGRFVEIEPGRLVRQSVEFESDDPAFSGEMVMTWSFETARGGTMVGIVASNVPAGISSADHQAGLDSSLSNLARFVERDAQPAPSEGQPPHAGTEAWGASGRSR
jgi:uncharacterized protein YndB with AHSA1/START domain